MRLRTRSTLLVALVAGAGCARVRVHPVVTDVPRMEAAVEGLGDSLLRERSHGDSLRLEVLRLEEALRARDDTIGALKLELQRLKEIDLRPRPRPRDPTGTGVREG